MHATSHSIHTVCLIAASDEEFNGLLNSFQMNSFEFAVVGEQENPELMMGTLLQDMTRDVQKLRTVYSQVPPPTPSTHRLSGST